MSKGFFWVVPLALWSALAAGESVPATQKESIMALLSRMSTAVHSLDYEGSIVYAHGGILEAMRVVHGEQDGYEREKIITLTGPAHEIVRDNFTTTRVHAEHQSVSVEDRHYGRSSPTLVSFDPVQVAKSYEFRPGDPRRVAGRTTRTFAIVPKHPDRYGYRLFVDAEHALPLKFDVVDSKGIISQLMFTDIEIHNDEKATIGRGLMAGAAPLPPERREYKGPWRFNNVPSGFELEFFKSGSESKEAEHFVFSDGMATLSVYIENDNTPGLEGERRIGPVGVYGGHAGNHQVIVVGEIPVETLRRFFLGVKLESARDKDG